MDTPTYHRQRQAAHDAAVNEARILGAGRMLRDDQELTPELTESVVRRFKELLGRIGKSEGWAGKSLDIKPSTLSQVLSGKYEGDTESRIRLIDKWTEAQIAREQSPRPSGFATTATALSIFGLAKETKRDGCIGVCYGPSGIGKTMTAEFIVSELPGSILLRITTAGAGPYAVWTALADQLRVPTAGKTAFQMQRALIEILNGTNRLLIVDEAHKLCMKHKDHGLHALRDLHDITGILVLLLGTEDIKNYIDNPRDAAEAVEQIYGRVGGWLDLTHAASQLDGGQGNHSIEDIRKILTANQMRIRPDGERYLVEISNLIGGGGLRVCVSL